MDKKLQVLSAVPSITFETTDAVMKAEAFASAFIDAECQFRLLARAGGDVEDVERLTRELQGVGGLFTLRERGAWRRDPDALVRRGRLRLRGVRLPGLFRLRGGHELRLAAEAALVAMTPLEMEIERLMCERPDEVPSDPSAELLAQPGFKIDTGPTGRPVGRPQKTTRPDEIKSQLRYLQQKVSLESVLDLVFGKGGGRRTRVEQDNYELLSLAVAAVLEAGDVSVRALAKALSVSHGTAHRLERHARHELDAVRNELIRNPLSVEASFGSLLFERIGVKLDTVRRNQRFVEAARKRDMKSGKAAAMRSRPRGVNASRRRRPSVARGKEHDCGEHV
jgi:hypothetical protein